MVSWFVVNIKPKKEFQVEKLFVEGGFKVYCPKVISENRVKPFFPGYAFLSFDHPTQYQMVKYTRGVKRVVGNRKGPIPVPDNMILGIQTREKNGYVELQKYGQIPEVGDEIEVMEGPLKGLKGIFQKAINDRERVMILLNYVSYQGMLLIEKIKVKKVAR